MKKNGRKPRSLKGVNIYRVLIISAIMITALLVVFVFLPALNGVKERVEDGDIVTVSYKAMYENGEVFEQSTVSFRVGGGKVIEGFEKNVKGMALGEEKGFVVKPEEAYGNYSEKKIVPIALVKTFNKTINISVNEFKELFGNMPKEGKTYNTSAVTWPVKVRKVINRTVEVEQLAKDGEVINLSYGYSLVEVKNKTINVRLFPRVGSEIDLFMLKGRIKYVNKTHMLVDLNHPLAGKTLRFWVKVISIEKGKRYEKPKLEFFINSECQASKDLLEVVYNIHKLFGSKVEIIPHYIIYETDFGNASMNCLKDTNYCSPYGSEDVEKSLIELCVLRDYGVETWAEHAYLMSTCFGGVEPCLDIVSNVTNVSVKKVKGCMEKSYAFLLEREYANMIKSGIKYYPTILINGRVYSVLDSESIKRELCASFKEKPKECEEEIKKVVVHGHC